MSLAPRVDRVSIVVSKHLTQSGCEASATIITASEFKASSKVEEKASMREWGRFCIKPTVSETKTFWHEGRMRALVVVSRVAHSLSSARTLDFVR